MTNLILKFTEQLISQQRLESVQFREGLDDKWSHSANLFPLVVTCFVNDTDAGFGLAIGDQIDPSAWVDYGSRRLVLAIFPTVVHLDYRGEGVEPVAENMVWSSEQIARVTHLVQLLAKLPQSAYLAREQLLYGELILLTIVKLFEHSATESAVQKDVQIFNRLSALITAEHRQVFSRPELAERLGVSDDGLNLIVKRYRGFSFQTYYNLCRLETARRLLMDRDYAVGEVAQRCGFNSTAYFVKLFRQFYDITPLQFRKLHGKPGKSISDWERFNYTHGFVYLSIEAVQLELLPLRKAVHCACLVCNVKRESIKLYAHYATGERFFMGVIKPLERWQFGFTTGATLEFYTDDDRFLGSCYSLSVPSLILCSD